VLWRWTALQLALAQAESAGYDPLEPRARLSSSECELLRFGARKLCGCASSLRHSELAFSAAHAAALEATCAAVGAVTAPPKEAALELLGEGKGAAVRGMCRFDLFVVNQ